MAKSRLCLILDFRMPLFLADFTLLEIGKGKNYFDPDRTEESFRERYEKIIKPLLDTAEDLIRSKDFRFSLFMSGTFLDLLNRNYQKEIKRFKKMLGEGSLDLIGGCYSNSLASLYSMRVFEYDIARHQKQLLEIFDYKAEAFMNPENIYSNEIALDLKNAGFKACFIDNVPWYLNNKHPRQIFKAFMKGTFHLMVMEYASGKLLQKDTRDKYSFIKLVPYAETQGKDWGTRLKALIVDDECHTVKDALKNSRSSQVISAPSPIGAVARPQGLAGLIHNPMQKKSLQTLFSMEDLVFQSGDQKLINEWVNLSNVEYLMSMNPDKVEGTRPYDIFIRYMNILTDINIKLS